MTKIKIQERSTWIHPRYRNALKNIRALQENMDAQGYGLRFGYTDGGCSGNKYIIEFEDAPEEMTPCLHLMKYKSL